MGERIYTNYTYIHTFIYKDRKHKESAKYIWKILTSETSRSTQGLAPGALCVFAFSPCSLAPSHMDHSYRFYPSLSGLEHKSLYSWDQISCWIYFIYIYTQIHIHVYIWMYICIYIGVHSFQNRKNPQKSPNIDKYYFGRGVVVVLVLVS